MQPDNRQRLEGHYTRQGLLEWGDRCAESLVWCMRAAARFRSAGPAPVGLHLLMGASALPRPANLIGNLQESRITMIQSVAGRA